MDKKYCECGCGQKVKKGNRFIHGHNAKKEPKEQKECACGCGQLAKPGNRFIRGHNNRGKKLNLSEEQRRERQEVSKNNWKNPKIRASMTVGIKKAKNTEKGKKDNSRAGKAGLKVIREKLKNNPIYKKEKRIQSSKAAKKLWDNRKEDMLIIRKNQWTEEARENMSIASKKRLEDPNERKKFKAKSKIKETNNMLIKHIVILLLLAIITTAHINFVIRIPEIVPLFMKVDSSIVTTFSGGELTLSNGVYILSNP